MLLPTRQSDLNGLASVAEALIAGLYDNKPNGTWNPHTVEVAGERLLARMVVDHWGAQCIYAQAHLRTVSSVRVVMLVPKVRSSRLMNTGPLGPGT